MEEKQTTQSTAPGPGCFFCEAVRPFVHALWSDATRSHFRNSRVEFLKGVRSLIDDRISRLQRHEERGTRVTVE